MIKLKKILPTMELLIIWFIKIRNHVQENFGTYFWKIVLGWSSICLFDFYKRFQTFVWSWNRPVSVRVHFRNFFLKISQFDLWKFGSSEERFFLWGLEQSWAVQFRAKRNETELNSDPKPTLTQEHSSTYPKLNKNSFQPYI